MNILAISGSTRERSTNTALLLALKDLAPSGVELSVFQNLNALPIFSPDDEGKNTPIEVEDFMGMVSSADGIIISSPEYIHAIPGGLKNALDWMVSRFEIIGKPIALVHASHRGDDMLDSLRLVLSTVSDNFFENIFLRIPLVGMSPEEISALLSNPEYGSQMLSFLADFTAAANKSHSDYKKRGSANKSGR